MKPYRVLIAIVLIALFAVTLYSADLNKVRGVYGEATAQSPLDGYWTSTGVDNAYVNHYPTCVVYNFTATPDLIGTAISIDFPLWKHWGEIGSYIVTVTDTGAEWVTTDDSVYVDVGLYVISANGETLELANSLTDSAIGGDQRLGGETWVGTVGGEITIAEEVDYWEHLQVSVAQSNTADVKDAVTVRVTIALPYSEEYLRTSYYQNVEVTR